MKKHFFSLVLLMTIAVMLSCQQKNQSEQNNVEQTHQEGTFGYDLHFLNQYKKTIVLAAPDNADAKAILVANYQGRVMTSTADGDAGNSYGWINYGLIESGKHQPHMNAFGGEERFWLSPEGGQFSIYFKNQTVFLECPDCWCFASRRLSVLIS